MDGTSFCELLVPKQACCSVLRQLLTDDFVGQGFRRPGQEAGGLEGSSCRCAMDSSLLACPEGPSCHDVRTVTPGRGSQHRSGERNAWTPRKNTRSQGFQDSRR